MSSNTYDVYYSFDFISAISVPRTRLSASLEHVFAPDTASLEHVFSTSLEHAVVLASSAFGFSASPLVVESSLAPTFGVPQVVSPSLVFLGSFISSDLTPPGCGRW